MAEKSLLKRHFFAAHVIYLLNDSMMLKVVPRDCIPQDKSSKGKWKWKWKRCFIKFQKLLKLRKSINIFIPFQNCNFSCSCNKLTKKTITFETIFRHVARAFYLNLNLFSEFLQYLFGFSEKRSVFFAF